MVTRKGVLDTFLPEDQRSGQTTIEVRNKRSHTHASRVLQQTGICISGTATTTAAGHLSTSLAKAAIDTAAAEMNETIRVIQDRLNPAAVNARAKHDVLGSATR